VTGGATAENYTLTAKVAQLVNFAAGTSSITLKGNTLKGYVFSYALNGSAGQTMTATLNVPSSAAYHRHLRYRQRFAAELYRQILHLDRHPAANR
jgi:hypothetical protein